jgi:hypothetical protein
MFTLTEAEWPLLFPDLSDRFAAQAATFGVTDEDGDPISAVQADYAIQSVKEALDDEWGYEPNPHHGPTWSEIEARVLDRFGADPDAFQPDWQVGL